MFYKAYQSRNELVEVILSLVLWHAHLWFWNDNKSTVKTCLLKPCMLSSYLFCQRVHRHCNTQGRWTVSCHPVCYRSIGQCWGAWVVCGRIFPSECFPLDPDALPSRPPSWHKLLPSLGWRAVWPRRKFLHRGSALNPNLQWILGPFFTNTFDSPEKKEV